MEGRGGGGLKGSEAQKQGGVEKFLEFCVLGGGGGYLLIIGKNGKRENIDSWWGFDYTFSRKFECSKVQNTQILRDIGHFAVDRSQNFAGCNFRGWQNSKKFAGCNFRGSKIFPRNMCMGGRGDKYSF